MEAVMTVPDPQLTALAEAGIGGEAQIRQQLSLGL